MARCPNAPRKRKGAGGGTPGCDGDVILVMKPSVSVDLKRIPRGGDRFENIVKIGVRKRGVKVPSIDLERCYATGKFDIICPRCGWRLSACTSGSSKSLAKKAAVKTVKRGGRKS